MRPRARNLLTVDEGVDFLVIECDVTLDVRAFEAGVAVPPDKTLELLS